MWRVLERSHLIVQIVDARNPLRFRCEDLEEYIQDVEGAEEKAGTDKGKKRSMLLINKADFLTTGQRLPFLFYKPSDLLNEILDLNGQTISISRVYNMPFTLLPMLLRSNKHEGYERKIRKHYFHWMNQRVRPTTVTTTSPENILRPQQVTMTYTFLQKKIEMIKILELKFSRS